MPPVRDCTLLPWTQAVAALGDRPVRLRVVAPPYPAAGTGVLRCLRVLAPERDGDPWRLDAGYEGYTRR